LLYIQWRKYIFDLLLILYVCPFTKKKKKKKKRVYHFYGRFILTDRDRISTTTKNPEKNRLYKGCKLICISVSEISIESPCKHALVLVEKPLLASTEVRRFL